MPQKQLSQKITLTSLVSYYISTVVGAGIFLVPMEAAKLAGPASLISWMLVLIIVYPFATIFANIAQEYQTSGSVQKFLEDASSKQFGKSIALFIVISAMVGTFLLGHTSAQYVIQLFDLNQEHIIPIAIFLMLLSCIFNLMNIGISSSIQSICLYALILVLVAIICLSFPFYNPRNIDNFMPHGIEPVIAAVLLCFYSATGWENVDSIAEEVKNPKKTYAKAIKISISLIGVLYLAIATTVIMVIPQYLLMTSGNTVLSVLLEQEFGHTAAKAGSAIAVVLLLLGANSWVLGTSRMIFALATSNGLPKILGRVNRNTSIPTFAVIAQMPCYLVIGYLVHSQNLGNKLLEVAGMNYLLFYMIIFSCGIKQFKDKKVKKLSAFALLVAIALLMNCANFQSIYSLIMLSLALVYTYHRGEKSK